MPSRAGMPNIIAAPCGKPRPIGKPWGGSNGSKYTLA